MPAFCCFRLSSGGSKLPNGCQHMPLSVLMEHGVSLLAAQIGPNVSTVTPVAVNSRAFLWILVFWIKHYQQDHIHWAIVIGFNPLGSIKRFHAQVVPRYFT